MARAAVLASARARPWRPSSSRLVLPPSRSRAPPTASAEVLEVLSSVDCTNLVHIRIDAVLSGVVVGLLRRQASTH